jgi:predicted neuraminidase
MENPTSSSLIAPPLNASPRAEYSSSTRRFQGIPALERTPNGRLWAAWYAGGPDEPGEGPGNYVVLVTSDDDGATWSSLRLVIDPPGQVRAFDPCLWIGPQDRLWLFWAQSEGLFDGRGGVWAIDTWDLENENPHWSSPTRFSDGVMMNKPTVASDKSWLLPVGYWARGNGYDAPSGSHLLISKDNGNSFRLQRGPQVPKVTFDEHMVVERRNGSLWMLVRTKYGIGESTSQDGGQNWSAPQPSGISHVDSRFFIGRLRSGNLLLITHNPPDNTSRSHLSAHISRDDGCTWSEGLLIDERLGVSYPDAVEGEDGKIYAIYDFERHQSRQILLATFTEETLLNQGAKGRNGMTRSVVDQATG